MRYNNYFQATSPILGGFCFVLPGVFVLFWVGLLWVRYFTCHALLLMQLRMLWKSGFGKYALSLCRGARGPSPPIPPSYDFWAVMAGWGEVLFGTSLMTTGVPMAVPEIGIGASGVVRMYSLMSLCQLVKQLGLATCNCQLMPLLNRTGALASGACWTPV